MGGVTFVLVLVVISLMLFSMWVSSSPVRVHLRYSRDSVWAVDWVCLSTRMSPWYSVVRFISSMCMPQLHLSCCRGVLAEMMWGVFVWSIGIECGVFWHQSRRA
jgi:hypothetical protein